MLTTHLFHLEYFTILRDIVASFLANEKAIQLRKAGPEHVDLEKLLSHQQVDILLLGVNNNNVPVEPLKALGICQYIRDHFPATRIIAHSMYNDPPHIVQLMNAGATGFVSKQSGYEELFHAIAEANTGKRYLGTRDAAAFKNTADFISGRTNKLIEKERLFSARELEVLALIAKGYNTQEIAGQMYIALKTVETHRKNLVAKSRVKNTAELISFSYSRGLL